MARPRLPLPVAESTILEAYEAGESLQGIAADLGIDRARVTRVVDEAGLRGATVTALPYPKRVPPPGTVDSNELIQLAQISYRQLDHWTRAGLLHPVGKANPGSGASRYYPLTEVVVATLMRRLLDDGLLPNAAHDHARRLLQWGTTSIAGMTLHLPEDV